MNAHKDAGFARLVAELKAIREDWEKHPGKRERVAAIMQAEMRGEHSRKRSAELLRELDAEFERRDGR